MMQKVDLYPISVVIDDTIGGLIDAPTPFNRFLWPEDMDCRHI